jgi:biopolymer transport protein ExbD
MKFPRNARISRGQMDATPFAGMFFCLLIFILLASLVYTPGVQIQLPTSMAALPGIGGPTLAVALDANGQYYFQNAVIFETNLQARLREEVARQNEPLTLVVQADKAATVEQLNHLRDLAAAAGVRQIFQQILPGIYEGAKKGTQP